jgi:hypothetical protein
VTERDDDDDIAPDEPAPEPALPAGRPARPLGRLVRIGCIVLGLLGALAAVFSGQSVANPELGICNEALTEIDAFQDDLPDDTTATTTDVDEIDCSDDDERASAIAQAEGLDDVSLHSESYFRTSAAIGLAIGLLLAVGALLTHRTMSRRWRLVTLVGAGLGLVFFGLVLFPIVLVGLGFGVYAIFFSSDARAVFGNPGGPRMFRPRTS